MIIAVIYYFIALANKVVVVHFLLKVSVEMDVLLHKFNSTYRTGVYERLGGALGFLSENVLRKTLRTEVVLT